MPLSNDNFRNAQTRVMGMFMDTIRTFEALHEHAPQIYGDRAQAVRAAIDEYLNDFLRHTAASGERHPEDLIFSASRENFQRAGFYGAQLDLKERQVTRANGTLRQRLASGVRALWHQPFRKWVDIINNFLSSLAGATGLSEALKELKDCLRDEMPDDDQA